MLLKDGSTTLAVIYYLIASLDPKYGKKELFADPTCTVSVARDERIIYVYREMGAQSECEPKPKLTQKLSSKIGGVLGLGAQKMECNITIEKEHFVPKEKAQIIFEINNSQCSKAVKSFKVKVFREIKVKKGPRTIYLKGEYIKQMKSGTDIKAKTTAVVPLFFQMPSAEFIDTNVDQDF